MPLADRKIAMAGGSGWLVKVSPEAIRVFDETIIRQAGTAGWRIGLSELVHWRLNEWDQAPEHSPVLRRYYRALIRAARIFQGSKKPPLDDPGLYAAKVEAVNELTALLSRMREVFRGRQSNSPEKLESELTNFFLNEISRRSKSLRYLAVNCDAWRAFITEHATDLRVHCMGARIRPASLFYLWMAWCKKVDPERLRQAISRLGSSPAGSRT